MHRFADGERESCVAAAPYKTAGAGVELDGDNGVRLVGAPIERNSSPKNQHISKGNCANHFVDFIRKLRAYCYDDEQMESENPSVCTSENDDKEYVILAL